MSGWHIAFVMLCVAYVVTTFVLAIWIDDLRKR